jgi:hypothetical protein
MDMIKARDGRRAFQCLECDDKDPIETAQGWLSGELGRPVKDAS